MSELTKAQADALRVLAAHPNYDVDGAHESSVGARRVNSRAASALVKKGLARSVHLWEFPNSHFRITDEGLAVYENEKASA